MRKNITSIDQKTLDDQGFIQSVISNEKYGYLLVSTINLKQRFPSEVFDYLANEYETMVFKSHEDGRVGKWLDLDIDRNASNAAEAVEMHERMIQKYESK